MDVVEAVVGAVGAVVVVVVVVVGGVVVVGCVVVAVVVVVVVADADCGANACFVVVAWRERRQARRQYLFI